MQANDSLACNPMEPQKLPRDDRYLPFHRNLSYQPISRHLQPLRSMVAYLWLRPWEEVLQFFNRGSPVACPHSRYHKIIISCAVRSVARNQNDSWQAIGRFCESPPGGCLELPFLGVKTLKLLGSSLVLLFSMS